MEPVVAQTVYPDFSWHPVLIVIVLILIGILLLGMEIFVLPGFGISGVLGLISFVSGMVVSWIYLGPTWGALVFVGTSAFSTAVFIWGLKSKIIRRRFILSEGQSEGKGVETGELSNLVGVRGRAVSDLRPSGIAEIQNRRLDVVSDGDFIDAQSTIEVVMIDGPSVVVAKVTE